ncbi:MAG: hypothetical protein LBT50_08960 [Prevotellaceae bacterium]|jgi:hypothetical protein|nr:hypothetical protein [Prevotellaceae bacterium]
MTKNILKLASLFFICQIVFSACNNEIEPTDVSASEVAGNYVAVTATYLLNSDGTLSIAGDNFEDMFDIDFLKITVSGKKITAKESNGDLVFESVSVVEAGNGVAFNLALPSELISDMEELGYTTAGFGMYQLDGKKYHAFYIAKEEHIDFALAVINEDVKIPDIVVEVVCNK